MVALELDNTPTKRSETPTRDKTTRQSLRHERALASAKERPATINRART
jgi:hypothetical protein